jgi:23S rRNA (guanosine2251-2'-O)-methyltransferase
MRQGKRSFSQSHSSRKPPSGLSSDIVYGKNPVREAYQAGRRKIHEILLAGNPTLWQKEALVAEATARRIPVQFVNSHRLDDLTQGGIHQGVVARVAPYPYQELSNLIAKGAEKSLLVILDSIQDPQNLGAICRAAKALGAGAVIVAQDHTSPISAVVCKASAGAVEHLDIVRVVNLARAMEELKKNGYWLYGASLEPQSQDLDKIDPAAKSVLVLGAEGAGLRRLVAETCDVLVKIPMVGGFESLNVAQAAAILIYGFGKKINV